MINTILIIPIKKKKKELRMYALHAIIMISTRIILVIQEREITQRKDNQTEKHQGIVTLI